MSAKFEIGGDASGAVKAVSDLDKALGKAGQTGEKSAKQIKLAEEAAKRLGVEVYSLRIPGRRWPSEEGRFDKRQRLLRLGIERVLEALGIHGARQELVFGDGPDV